MRYAQNNICFSYISLKFEDIKNSSQQNVEYHTNLISVYILCLGNARVAIYTTCKRGLLSITAMDDCPPPGMRCRERGNARLLTTRL